MALRASPGEVFSDEVVADLQRETGLCSKEIIEWADGVRPHFNDKISDRAALELAFVETHRIAVQHATGVLMQMSQLETITAQLETISTQRDLIAELKRETVRMRRNAKRCRPVSVSNHILLSCFTLSDVIVFAGRAMKKS